MTQKASGFVPTPGGGWRMEVGDTKGKRGSRKGGEQSQEKLEERLVLVQEGRRRQKRNPRSPANI